MPLLVALSLLVVSELTVQAGKVEEFLTLVHDGVEVSRSFSGNQGFEIYVETESPGKALFIKQRGP